MNLGENIYRLRTEKNMSQGDLAEALDVSRQSVSKWENNSAVPELEKLVKMAALFGTTLDTLVGQEPSTPQTHEPTPPPVEIQRSPVPVLTYVGVALLCCAIISLVLFLIFGEEHWFLYDCIFYISLPLGVGSALCLSPSKKFRRNLIIGIGVIIGSVAALWLIVHTAPVIGSVFTSVDEFPVQNEQSEEITVEPDPTEITILN